MIDPKKIVQGDCLHWEDPADDTCSEDLVVESVKYNEDSDMITIQTDVGTVLHAFAEELSYIV